MAQNLSRLRFYLFYPAGPLFHLGIIGLLIFYNALLYLSHSLPLGLLFNSDTLYLPSLYKDLVEEGGKYADWFLSPAPYFFPDMVMYFLINSFTDNVYYASGFFFIAQFGLEVFFAFQILKALSNRAMAARLTVITVSLVSVLFSMESLPYFAVMGSVGHHGAYLCLLASLFILVKYFQADSSKIAAPYLAALVLITTLIVASDKIFVMQFVAPAVMTLLFFWLINQISCLRALIALAVLGLSVLLGYLLNHWLVVHQTGYNIKLSPDNLVNNLSALKKLLLNFYGGSPFICLLILAIYGLCIIFLIRFATSGFRQPDPSNVLVSFFILTCGGINLTVLALCNLYLDEGSLRYMIPVFTNPVILLPAMVLAMAGSAGYSLDNKITSPVIITCLLVVPISSPLKASLQKSYYPELIECVDKLAQQTGLKRGFGEYWHARQLSMLSQVGVNVLAVNFDLSPYLWITNKSWYRDPYDFAILSSDPARRLDMNKIELINGPPKSTHTCHDSTLLYYGPAGLRTSISLGSGESFSWQACTLPGATGSAGPGCSRTADPAQDSQGHLTFGPYQPLPAGRYTFNISYLSPGGPSRVTGSWDVYANAHGREAFLARGDFKGTDSRPARVDGEFTVPGDLAGERFEIRSFFSGSQALTIQDIGIRRLE